MDGTSIDTEIKAVKDLDGAMILAGKICSLYSVVDDPHQKQLLAYLLFAASDLPTSEISLYMRTRLWREEPGLWFSHITITRLFCAATQREFRALLTNTGSSAVLAVEVLIP